MIVMAMAAGAEPRHVNGGAASYPDPDEVIPEFGSKHAAIW